MRATEGKTKQKISYLIGVRLGGAISAVQRLLVAFALLALSVFALAPPQEVRAGHFGPETINWARPTITPDQAKGRYFVSWSAPPNTGSKDIYGYWLLCERPDGAFCSNPRIDLGNKIGPGLFSLNEPEGYRMEGLGGFRFQIEGRKRVGDNFGPPEYSAIASVSFTGTGVCRVVNNKMDPPKNITATYDAQKKEFTVFWEPIPGCSGVTYKVAASIVTPCVGTINTCLIRYVAEIVDKEKVTISSSKVEEIKKTFSNAPFRFCVDAFMGSANSIDQGGCASSSMFEQDGRGGFKTYTPPDDCDCPSAVTAPIARAFCVLSCYILGIMAKFINLALSFLQKTSGL